MTSEFLTLVLQLRKHTPAVRITVAAGGLLDDFVALQQINLPRGLVQHRFDVALLPLIETATRDEVRAIVGEICNRFPLY